MRSLSQEKGLVTGTIKEVRKYLSLFGMKLWVSFYTKMENYSMFYLYLHICMTFLIDMVTRKKANYTVGYSFPPRFATMSNGVDVQYSICSNQVGFIATSSSLSLVIKQDFHGGTTTKMARKSSTWE